MIRNFLRLPAGLCLHPRLRSELLERVLARAAAPRELPDWRAAAFRSLSQEALPPVAAAALAGAELPSQSVRFAEFPWVWLATPLHLEPGLDNVRLPADGILRLAGEEARLLAQDFQRLWADAPLRLEAIATTLYVLAQASWPAVTHDPQDFLGEHIDDYLPQGAGAPHLKALMSEIEMWLFEHAVNRERARLGKPSVTGLWLWGGGARGPVPATPFRAAGDDALFGALRAEGTETKVVVASHAPGSLEWSATEEPWLRTSLSMLNEGATLAISIQRRCYEVSSRWRWRWFRKSRAWWEYFEE